MKNDQTNKVTIELTLTERDLLINLILKHVSFLTSLEDVNPNAKKVATALFKAVSKSLSE